MNINKFYISLIIVCSLALSLFSIGAKIQNVSRSDGKTDRSKIIIFSHKFHISSGVDCVDCHRAAKESQNSGDNLLPKMADCYTCHDEKSTPCEKCHPKGAEAVPFDNPKRDIAYSHKFHIETAKLECTGCHQNLDTVDYSYQAEKGMPSMDICLGCHNNGFGKSKTEIQNINKSGLAAPKNCEICHNDLTNIRPKTHSQPDFTKLHGRMVRIGKFDNDCQTCHTESYCQTCHNGSPLLALKDVIANKSSDLSTKPENSDDSKKMVLQNVHSLNYILTHGFDARSKKTECYTCHDEQRFCNDCHSGKEEGVRVKPKWHTSAGFTTIGRGSSGGVHAVYAKREIETCAGCHDTQGNDPICTMCHVDPDGIKGTNPKTHDSNFGSSAGHGIWHEDDGAICFNCHIDVSAKTRKVGYGFCGYCHGKKNN
jgi:hypothetical protein